MLASKQQSTFKKDFLTTCIQNVALIKASRLNYYVYGCVCVCYYLLYIRGSLGWGLHEYEAMFSGKCFTFFFLHLSPRLQVTKTTHLSVA